MTSVSSFIFNEREYTNDICDILHTKRIKIITDGLTIENNIKQHQTKEKLSENLKITFWEVNK